MWPDVMTVDSLYHQVTDAILHSEALEPGSPEAAVAHFEVSVLEARIADELPPSHPEGAIARRGAVRAAAAAGDYDRAQQLVELYLAEPDSPAELCRAIREF